MKFDLSALGITQEELQQRVVDKIAEAVLRYETDDENGDPVWVESDMKRTMDKLVRERINAEVQRLADAHVLPKVTQMIETITLQQTNKWGEKTGEPVTFIEYLVQRADFYMNESVDFQGKAKGQGDSYSWKGAQTRLTHLVHEHLHYSIEAAMKDAIKSVNAAIVPALAETARLKLAQLAGSLKVDVTAK
jgi:hypothetical protein